MKRFKIWWRAVILDYPYWRVRYKSGERTIMLYYNEANSLAKAFNGKLYIDYNKPLQND